MKFTFPEIKHEYPLLDIEYEMGRVRDLPVPTEWAEQNFKLTSSYANPGDYRAYPWQRSILDSILEYDTIILCLPVRLGKSLLAEIMIAYCIDNIPMNTMICYSKKEVVEDVFEDRIKPMILEIPAIRKYWTGHEKDLTRRKMRLRHMYMRVASAEVKSDIATFGSGLIYGSEVSKWRVKRGWNPVQALKGRQRDYIIMGRHKAIFESSPLFEGDCLDQEMQRHGVLTLQPYVPCLSCGAYQILSDDRIVEIPNAKGHKDHDPERIVRDSAARYDCAKCKKEIKETDRVLMSDRLVWASKNEQINKNGEIVGREKKSSVSFQGSRFLDFSFSFAECLATFYTARKKGIEALQVYRNEDMGMFWKSIKKEISGEYLLSRCAGYSQMKTGDIPNNVLILCVGADTQDNGFYFVVNGYTKGMNKYLIRAGFIEAPKDLSAGKDPRQLAFERFYHGLFDQPYIRRDGRKLEMYWGFIDEKGHRLDDVKYICDRIPKLHRYNGLSRINPLNPVIEESKTGDHFNGQSQVLSEEFSYILTSKTFFLPDDVPDAYLTQVKNEKIETVIDKYGNKRRVYVKTEPNHYRSCENYCLAAVKYTALEQILNDESLVAEIERNPAILEDSQDKEKEVEKVDDSEYFSNRTW